MTDKQMYSKCWKAISKAFKDYGFGFVNQYGYGQLVRRAWRDSIVYENDEVQEYFSAVFGGEQYAESFKLPLTERDGYKG